MDVGHNIVQHYTLEQMVRVQQLRSGIKFLQLRTFNFVLPEKEPVFSEFFREII